MSSHDYSYLAITAIVVGLQLFGVFVRGINHTPNQQTVEVENAGKFEYKIRV